MVVVIPVVLALYTGLTVLDIIRQNNGPALRKKFFKQGFDHFVLSACLVFATVFISDFLAVMEFSQITMLLVAFITNLILPYFSFGALSRHLPKQLILIIFYFNLFFNTIILVQQNYNDSFVFAYQDWLEIALIIFSLNIFCHGLIHGLTYLFTGIGHRTNPRTTNSFTRKNKKGPDMTQFYLEQGLNEQEVDRFRQEMGQARDHIFNLEKNVQATVKLRDIDKQTKLIELSQTYFKNIVHHPQWIVKADYFLYKLLPALDDLSEKYNEINGHLAKNKQTYIILEKTAETIQKLAQELEEDYMAFHKETFDSLEDELNFADRIINKEESWSSNTTMEANDISEEDAAESQTYKNQDSIEQLLEELEADQEHSKMED